RALRGDTAYGTEGKLAEIALLDLSGRQADAMSHIAEMEGSKPGEAASSWLRALKMRATGDYRVAQLPQAQLVERLEYGRTLSLNRDIDAYGDYLSQNPKWVDLIDWMRCGQLGVSSVESGNLYIKNSTEAELADMREDMQLRDLPPSSQSNM